ncbi:MAG: hypothetical protein MK202_07105 [Tenacibaculum sp.]|nr:hypothetical protein [Tenacibaculum sp.]
MAKSKYESQVKRGKLGCLMVVVTFIGLLTFFLIIICNIGQGFGEAVKNIATVLREKKNENFKFLEGT